MSATIATERSQKSTDPVDPAWMAYHVFYASDANPIIVEALRPLVARLKGGGLIDGWFFIKYWMDGPHVRFRVRPTARADRHQVDHQVMHAIKEFLARRPALYETDQDLVGDLYKDMFLAEYSEEEWDRKYGADGRMPMQANNTVVRYDYEPEYDRYGGRVGMDIAEWHFEASSDVVATLLATSNPHVRPILLGTGTQLSLMTAYTFLGTDQAVARFFERYRSFWETSYQQDSADYHESFDKTLRTCGEDLQGRIERIRQACEGGMDDRLSSLERTWLGHCRELVSKVREAADSGRLTFSRGSERSTIEDPEALATVLLSSYIHMTNNRLGLAILDEIYVSYLIQRRLNQQAGSSAETSVRDDD